MLLLAIVPKWLLVLLVILIFLVIVAIALFIKEILLESDFLETEKILEKLCSYDSILVGDIVKHQVSHYRYEFYEVISVSVWSSICKNLGGDENSKIRCIPNVNLERIGSSQLLHRLFNRVQVPSSVKLYNDRATISTFDNLHTEKAVTKDGDKFDPLTGVLLTTIKNSLGQKKYNMFLTEVYKRIEEAEKINQNQKD